MRRIVTLPLLLIVVAQIAAPLPVTAQQAEPEVKATVYYIDPATNKEVDVDGFVIQETIAGMKMRLGKEEKLIPALDIRQVTYKTKVNPLDYRKAFTTATKATDPDLDAAKKLELYEDSLREFKKLLPDVKDVPQATRYINYKVVEVQGAVARLDDKKIDNAIQAIEAFRTEYNRGWQVLPSLKMLADLQELKGDLTAAGKVYEEITSLPDAPESVKDTAQLLEAQMLLRSKKYKDAETKLIAARARLLPANPQRAQLTVLICQAKMSQGKLDGVDKELTAALGTTTDNNLRAVGHNCMGDFYLQKKQPEEAFWEYLKVHLMYSQNRTEHARAMYHLSNLFFTVQKDPIRAQEVLERLTDKEYDGTEYQARAKAEKKPMEPETKEPAPKP